ncbi:hypothetical protein HN358_02435 [Candidatus Uhrbacteria bacterium]|jgi:DNA-binding NarL/FixJ family response regulator|nr:hypothetical protein [Candidatus Uhrbacteria bacterium]MBT7717537.1 hypothetical protein [Candidatus Uhrbacteria bacterium]
MRILIIASNLPWRESLEHHIDTIEGTEVMVAFNPYAGIQAILQIPQPGLIITRMMFTECENIHHDVRGEAGVIIAAALRVMEIDIPIFIASDRCDPAGMELVARHATKAFIAGDSSLPEIVEAVKTLMV